MTVVLDPCALMDANMDDINGKPSVVDDIIGTEPCYMAPINVVETYIGLRDRISTELAEAVMKMIMENVSIKIINDRDPELIRLVAEARDHGVPYTVAFIAASAKHLDCEILTNERDFDHLEKAGFCRIRHY